MSSREQGREADFLHQVKFGIQYLRTVIKILMLNKVMEELILTLRGVLLAAMVAISQNFR